MEWWGGKGRWSGADEREPGGRKTNIKFVII